MMMMMMTDTRQHQ